jgi:uncharacterized protein
MNDRSKNTKGLLIFVGIALGLAVFHWILFDLATAGLIRWQPSRDLFNLLRSFGPTLAAMTAAFYLGGRPGIREIWSRTVRWRILVSNYVIALVGPLLAICIVLMIVHFKSPEVLARGEVNLLKLAAIFFVLPFLDGPLGEEIGWRGFFLPELQKRYSPIVSSLIVGVVWYSWHLPLYHSDGWELSPTILLKYLLLVVSLSFLHTWLFKRSGESVLLAVLFHNMTNYVVLLSFTLFPGLLKTEFDDDIYTFLVIIFGVFAAVALARGKAVPEQALGPA